MLYAISDFSYCKDSSGKICFYLLVQDVCHDIPGIRTVILKSSEILGGGVKGPWCKSHGRDEPRKDVGPVWAYLSSLPMSQS